MGDALNYQRYFLYSQIRVSVANAASSNATVKRSFPSIGGLSRLLSWIGLFLCYIVTDTIAAGNAYADDYFDRIAEN